MAIFVVLWSYLLTTNLSCLKKNIFVHTNLFFSLQAYMKHRNEFHGTKSSSASEKSDEDSEPVKKTPNKPGPRTKKSKAKITEERRKSNRSSSSSSENEVGLKSFNDLVDYFGI